jgi:hypothetical protein
LEIKTSDEWRTHNYALRDRYEGLVFDRSLRGANAASRVLGASHLLFDVAIEEAQSLSVSFTCVSGLIAPLMIVTVEDEVTGTGALVHRLIFGVTEKGGEAEVLRDWELLLLLNTCSPKGPVGSRAAQVEARSTAERLKTAFDADLVSHAPTLRRPISRSEMLLIAEDKST